MAKPDWDAPTQRPIMTFGTRVDWLTIICLRASEQCSDDRRKGRSFFCHVCGKSRFRGCGRHNLSVAGPASGVRDNRSPHRADVPSDRADKLFPPDFPVRRPGGKVIPGYPLLKTGSAEPLPRMEEGLPAQGAAADCPRGDPCGETGPVPQRKRAGAGPPTAGDPDTGGTERFP